MFFKTSYHFIAGNTEGNKKVCSCILNKIIEDPLSGSCPNLSYADVNGPVANFNPTGSPYALATTNCCTYYYNYLLKYNYCVIFIYTIVSDNTEIAYAWILYEPRPSLPPPESNPWKEISSITEYEKKASV